MPQITQYLFMALGAALVVIGTLLLVFKPAIGQNTMKFLGMEVSFSASGLIVVALGCLMFAGPFLIPPQTQSMTTGSGPSLTQTGSGPLKTDPTSGSGPKIIEPPPPHPITKRARAIKLCRLPEGTPLTLLAFKKLTAAQWEYFGYPVDTDGQQHNFYGVVIERNPASLSLGYGYENGSGPQIQKHSQSNCAAFVPFTPSVKNARPVILIDDWTAGNWASVEVWERN